MRAYHFLRSDLTAGSGTEKPWRVGEEREWAGKVKLCYSGYHSSPTLLDALAYTPGPVACLVEVSEPVASQGRIGSGADAKQVSRRRKLLVAADATRELRLFACECAERALERERAAGRTVDERSSNAIVVARRHAEGEATDEELAAARDAAWAAASAARAAARDAASFAARDAAWAAASAARAAARDAASFAARAAASAAAWDAEIDWQERRLTDLLEAKLEVPGRETARSASDR